MDHSLFVPKLRCSRGRLTFLWLLVGIVTAGQLGCDKPERCTASDSPPQRRADIGGRGLIHQSPGAADGFILFSPLLATTTYLIDREGRVVHTWETGRAPGASVYLLENGHLLRCSRETDTPVLQAGGEGGRLQELSWDGDLVWEYVVASPRRVQHHDIEPLANGNVLALVWEHKSRQEAIVAGRRPELVPDAGLLSESVIEVEKAPPNGGKIVWEWHLWDHLIQDHEAERRNFGSVADHPELVDINGDRTPREMTDEVVDRLKTLGYVVGAISAKDLAVDVVHANSIAHNAALDQIALSAHNFGEIWIIDHSTTTIEAAGHTGGRARRGGDLLYRWGNPQAYRRGTTDNRCLFGHHDVRWIPRGVPGEGNIMVFNNGSGGPGRDRSTVLEIRPPVDEDGTYASSPSLAFAPERPVWTYPLPGKDSYSADFLSGAQRLENGNTLICFGPSGRLVEVTEGGETVWEYLNPFAGNAPNPAGDPPYSVFRATQIPCDHPAIADRLVALPEGRYNQRTPIRRERN